MRMRYFCMKKMSRPKGASCGSGDTLQEALDDLNEIECESFPLAEVEFFSGTAVEVELTVVTDKKPPPPPPKGPSTKKVNH